VRRGPSALDPTLPAALDAVVLRAVALDPSARYPRAGALADALEAVRRRPGPTAAALRLAKRATAAAVVAGVALLAGALAVRLARSEVREVAAVSTLGSTATTTSGRSSGVPPPATPDPAALRADDASQVLAALPHDDGADVYGVFVTDTAAITLGRDATARRWVLRPVGAHGPERWREDARLPLPAPGDALARSADRQQVLVGCRDGSIHELRVDDRATTTLGRTGARVEGLALDPGHAFAIACDRARGAVSLLRLLDGTIAAVGQAEAPAQAAVVTRAGRLIVAHGVDGQTGPLGHGVQAWDLSPEVLRWSVSTFSRCRTLALSPDERLVAVGDDLGQVTILTIDGGAARTVTTAGSAEIMGLGNTIRGLVFSPDGRRLYSASTSAGDVGGLRAFDTSTWREVRSPVPLEAPLSLDVSPDGRRLLVGSSRRRAEVWSAAE
jgi:hypothetical protein